MTRGISAGVGALALIAGLVFPFAFPIAVSAIIPGSKCPDPKGVVIECYDDTSLTGALFGKNGSIKAVCVSKGVCEGIGAKDSSGVMQALGLLNNALGLINGLKGLFQKPPKAPTAPLPPSGYYPGAGCSSGATSYPESAVVTDFGCCGVSGPAVNGSVLPPICARMATCPSTRMICCGGQWLLATSTSAACPAAAVNSSYSQVFNTPPAVTGTTDTSGAESVTTNRDIAAEILSSAPSADTSKTPPPPQTLEEIIRSANAKTVAQPTKNTQGLPPSVRGGVSGSSFVVEVQGNGEDVAGFYGAPPPPSATSNTFLSRMCVARPWAGSALSWLMDTSFFDGLCARYVAERGVSPQKIVDTTALSKAVVSKAAALRDGEVRKKIEKGIQCNPAIVRAGGTLDLDWSCGSSRVVKTTGFKTTAGTSHATLTPSADATYGISCEDGFSKTCTVHLIRPRVAVWTEPKQVRLGARAIVYWNTRDVVANSCVVTGPSFLEHGPSGGAATVAINDSSIYTIECLAADGATTTSSATLELSL